jgi:hypothetical protein
MTRPVLRVVRDSRPSPALELPRVRRSWWDGAAVGLALVGVLLVGAVGISLAMGWIR